VFKALDLKGAMRLTSDSQLGPGDYTLYVIDDF